MPANSGAGESAPKKEMTWREFFAGLATIAVLVIALKWHKVVRFYYINFEPIHLVGYAIVALAFGGAFYWFSKKTNGVKRDFERLLPLTSGASRIFAGTSVEAKLNLFVPNEARTGHVQILGATGRGKTESVIIPWILRDLKRGCSALLIDGKGDPSIVQKLEHAMKSAQTGQQLVVFDLGNPKTSCRINPLANGSPQQITDRIFTAFEFTDPFYRSVQYRACGALTALIRGEKDKDGKYEGEVTFRALYQLLTSADALSQAIGRCKSPTLQEQASRLLHQDARERDKQLQGLISQLEPLAVGEVAPLVNGGPGTHSIAEVVLGGSRVFMAILLPTLKYQVIGHQLGKCLLQELAWAVGVRASEGTSSFTPVYLDEFGAFVYPGFQNILNKARSAGVALHLSHQSMGDLTIVDPELAQIINTNTNVKCLLGLNDPMTADFFAKHLGTETEEKKTERAKRSGFWGGEERTGDYSLREVEAYRIHPNRLKNYTAGRGVLHVPCESGNITEEIQFERLDETDLAPPKVEDSLWFYSRV